MKLNQVPNLRVEDFPTQKEWIGKLFILLNSFIQAVNQVLSTQVDFTANIRSVSKTYSITSFQSFSFQWPYKDTPPVTLQVISSTKGSDKAATLLFAAWSYDSSETAITVSRISEMNASSVSELSGTYDFTIRATI